MIASERGNRLEYSHTLGVKLETIDADVKVLYSINLRDRLDVAGGWTAIVHANLEMS